jgi:hypothetical protein
MPLVLGCLCSIVRAGFLHGPDVWRPRLRYPRRVCRFLVRKTDTYAYAPCSILFAFHKRIFQGLGVGVSMLECLNMLLM